jgi:hypothetical protein
MALNVDTDGFRRTGDLVDLAGALLGSDFDDPTPTPPCASDPASEAIMRNLNARHDWLLHHVRAGAGQAANAADGMNDTATDYDTQDQIAATNYDQFGGGGGSSSTAAAGASQPRASAPPPAAMPNVEPVPDISGTEGEALALQLEAGAGSAPTMAAGAKLSTLAARAQAAHLSLADAHTTLLATGESQATPGMAAKLNKGLAFTQAVANHATVLADHYEAAGNLHALTYTQVGPSAGWQTLKTGYAESQLENALNGGLSQAKVDAFKQALDDKEQLKGAAATGLQNGGTVVSTPPGGVPDPGMDPNGQGAAGDDHHKGKKGGKDAKTDDPSTSSGGDMLEPLMGALGPLTQSLGKANPLQSLGQVGQVAQQLGQQVSKLSGEAAKKAAAPLNAAALGKHLPTAGKGAGGGGGKGGGSPIHPSSNLSSATRAASLGGAPSGTPAAASPPIKPASAGSTGAGGTGGGMMPMGHKAGGDDKGAKIDSYEQPLPEVESAGRAGVVGEVTRPAAPVVDPEAQNAVKARMERRKKDAAGVSDE